MRKLLTILISGSLLATSLVTLSTTPASAASTITTCTDLENHNMLVLKASKKSCKSMTAPALWQIQQPDSPGHSGNDFASIRICSSKNPSFSYQTIKNSCNKNQITTDYWRAILAPETPSIKEIMALGYDAAVVTFDPLKSESKIHLVIAYYLVTNIKTGHISKRAPNDFSEIYIYDLNPLTSYTFEIAAVSIDGTSALSSISRVITTGAVPIVIVAPVAPILAVPDFTLSASSETRTVNTAATGFTISSTGGDIASFAISATPAGMSFSTSTGALTGTPTVVADFATYIITATNASGSTTKAFSFVVSIASQTTLSITSLNTLNKTYPYSQVLSITSSGGSGSGATTYAIAPGGSASGCTLSSPTATGTITATTPGTCLIQATKEADSTYSSATSATWTFYFNKATPYLQFTNLFLDMIKNSDDVPFNLGDPDVTNNPGGTFTFSLANRVVATNSGRTVTILRAGVVVVTATFTPTDTTNYNTATISMTLFVYAILNGIGGGE